MDIFIMCKRITCIKCSNLNCYSLQFDRRLLTLLGCKLSWTYLSFDECIRSLLPGIFNIYSTPTN